MPNARIKACAELIWHSVPASAELGSALALWHKENLVRVRVLHFGAGRESFHVDIFAGRIRALHQVRFSGDRDPVWIISLCHLRRWRRSCEGRCRRYLRRRGWRRTHGLCRPIRVERLLRRWVFLRLSGSVSRRPVMLGRGRWWLLSARGNKEAREESKRQ